MRIRDLQIEALAKKSRESGKSSESPHTRQPPAGRRRRSLSDYIIAR
jgi:hypothetical protein